MSKNNDFDDFDSLGKNVYDTPLQEEAARSFLEYSYSVITSRALPDARDGLKPVHRRILFSMIESGLRPDHAFVKSARVVGDCMGKYHPHGDSAIYEALVRLTQDFSLNTPLISGHGNFGSPNDGPAAARYTECKLSPAAMLLVDELNEDTVNFSPNYDGSLDEPSVLPASYPNLLVNGSSGIAVGMATNMIPHNMGEVIEAARFLMKKPKATLDEIMEIVPGPDLPTGGLLLGLDEVRKAYEEGRGSVRMRGKAEVLPLEGSRGRSMIVITELPYGIGTEKVIEKIKDELGKKRLQGISDVKDLSDRRNGLRLIIETKTGINPNALLNDLYRYTPLETSFGIANLTLVNGEPKTLGLIELLNVFVEHRFDVVRRRTTYRLNKAEARKHIVDGLLIALEAIDEVVKIIKASSDTAAAREALCARFNLSDIQAGHILDMPLRRLVNLEIQALKDERAELEKAISGYNNILNDEKVMRKLIDSELADVAEKYATPRKTQLVPGNLEDLVIQASSDNSSVQIEDEAVEIYLSTTGLIARLPSSSEVTDEKKTVQRKRPRHDTMRSSLLTSTHATILAITDKGNAYKVPVMEIPALSSREGKVSLRGAMPSREIATMDKSETVIGIAPSSAEGYYGVAMATSQGTIKIFNFDVPQRSASFPIMSVKPGDEIIAAYAVKESDQLVLISSDTSLLTYSANLIRPQGKSGGGVAGMRVSADAKIIGFSVVGADIIADAKVVTATQSTVKVTPLTEYPSKGRGTGGVRSHKLLKGETGLVAAGTYIDAAASAEKGEPIDLPTELGKRDGSGVKIDSIAFIGRTYEN